jgi:hypothetical protein
MKKQLLILAALSLLTVGCQSSQSVKQSVVDNGSFMGLWNTFSNCQNTADFDQLAHDAAILNRAAKQSRSQDTFVLPLPGKLERLVATPSARLAVDVKAMSAACSLRAGQAAVHAQKIDIARELLHSILAYHPQSDYAFYSLQAKAILSELEPADIQVSLNTR